MSFDNPSNQSRAAKIIEILAHVDKSAKSNRASPDEIAALLSPVIDTLRQIGALTSTPAITSPDEITTDAGRQTETPTPGGTWAADKNAPAFAIIRDAAQNAPLADLGVAVAVYVTRLDDALYAMKGVLLFAGDGQPFGECFSNSFTQLIFDSSRRLTITRLNNLLNGAFHVAFHKRLHINRPGRTFCRLKGRFFCPLPNVVFRDAQLIKDQVPQFFVFICGHLDGPIILLPLSTHKHIIKNTARNILNNRDLI